MNLSSHASDGGFKKKRISLSWTTKSQMMYKNKSVWKWHILLFLFFLL